MAETNEAQARRLSSAIEYALWLHRDQRRKATTVPYCAHLLASVSLVLEHGGSTDEAIAAVLHDAVEDQGGVATALEVRRRFGDQVADIVLACTDGTPDEARDSTTWRARKERYLAHLPTVTPAARLVSASDKLHNARSLLADLREQGEQLWSRFNGGREGTLWYYRALADVFSSTPSPKPGEAKLAAELARVVSAIEAMATR